MRSAVKILLFLFTCAISLSCAQQSTPINGVSFVASPSPTSQEHIDPVLDVNANYAAVMPFGFIRSLDNPNIIYNTERQWYGETREGAKQYIDKLHENGIEVMLKPQIWVWRGEFTGYMKMNTEEDWKILEDSYRKFILEYADLAAQTGVQMFCIGTELEQFIMNRQDYWASLIQEIKSIYKGKLTYAANWDEYKRVPFWESLDFIGVDAYFPVSDSKTPTVEEARAGWQKWKDEMAGVSAKAGKPILFTEYGYRSVDYSGKEPWRSDRSMNQVNLEAQTNTITALYEEVWSQPWFAGGFVWKWFTNDSKVDGSNNSRFTPQNKPAENIIRQYYGQE